MGNETQGRQKRRTQAKCKGLCLKQSSEINGFCLKQGQGLKASTAPPPPKIPLSASPGPQ